MRIFLQGRSGKLGSKIEELFTGSIAESLPADVAIDVSAPDALEGLLQGCLETNTPLVIGTTGHSAKQIELLEGASKALPILIAPNFSPGIAHLNLWIKQQSMQPERIDIIETHHREKKDMPSGTALMLNQGLKNSTIQSLRLPDVIGEHEVVFTFEDEQIAIKHKALSRNVFAKGAIQAAQFLKDREPGLYTMENLCNLTN